MTDKGPNEGLIIGGVFSILAAFLCFRLWERGIIYAFDEYEIIFSFVSLFAFIFRLMSGILILKRRYFYLAIGGLVIMIVSTVLPFDWSYAFEKSVLEIPVVLMALISIGLTIDNRREFE